VGNDSDIRGAGLLKHGSSAKPSIPTDDRISGRSQVGEPVSGGSPPQTNATTCPRGVDAVALVVIVTATLAAFWPGLHNQFLNWDDDRNFLDNSAFQGLGLEQLRWAWSTYHLGVWQPLSWLLLSLQYQLGGLNPVLYHAFSLALHILNAVVFYLLTVKILQIASSRTEPISQAVLRGCAAAGTVLFAVHPLRVEAVAWISCQPYLPAALFYMLSVLAYLHGHHNDAERRGHLTWLAAAFALYLLAVMSKAVAVSLPVVLLILDIYPLRRWGGQKGWLGEAAARIWAEKLPFIVVAIVASVWAAQAKDCNESRVSFSLAAMDARLAQSAYGLVFYVQKTIAPTHLIPYYDLAGDLRLLTWRYALCAGGILAAAISLIFLRRRWPAALAAWLAYALILLPNLGIVQISRQLVTDRYSYIAIMPLMMLLAGAAFKFCASVHRQPVVARNALLVVLAVCVLGLCSASRRQALIWRDSVSLWQATLAVAPDCAVAECNLGTAFLQNEKYRDASLHLSRAIELDPRFAFAWANLGTVYNKARRHGDAVICFENALAGGTDLGRPDLAKTHAGLGEAYAALRRDDLAWQHTRKAQQLGFKDAQKMIDYLRRFSKEPPAQE
jgi:protein O-mannosyl-transferase